MLTGMRSPRLFTNADFIPSTSLYGLPAPCHCRSTLPPGMRATASCVGQVEGLNSGLCRTLISTSCSCSAVHSRSGPAYSKVVIVDHSADIVPISLFSARQMPPSHAQKLQRLRLLTKGKRFCSFPRHGGVLRKVAIGPRCMTKQRREARDVIVGRDRAVALRICLHPDVGQALARCSTLTWAGT